MLTTMPRSPTGPEILTGSYFIKSTTLLVPSVLWRCWLGGRKGIRPIKNEWWGVGVVVCLERGADLHMASWCHCHSLSLAPVKSRLVLPFWYWLTQVVLEKRPLNGCSCSSTLPQPRQWWRRNASRNCSWHSIHIDTRASGIHTGARVPTRKSFISISICQHSTVAGKL